MKMPRAVRLAAMALILCLAACETARPRARPDGPGGSSPDSDEVARLEARIIGLTAELNRVSRRVARLEGNPVPEPDLRAPALRPPESSAPPPPDESPPDADAGPPAPTRKPELDEVIDRMREAAPKPWSGILIDARALGEDAPAARGYPRWQVTDPDGGVLFSNEDLAPEFRATHPVFWTAPSGGTMGPEAIPVLGVAPFETEAVSAELVGEMEIRVAVGAESAKRLRAYRDLKALIRSGSIAVLMLERE